ncbi:MAG: class I SAM-dependent methyltransferase [Deltaproteobacteria bacterium]|jgi:predicted O-methyltransferase YrrM|nr:class I SAM-dependent methyltransferase [Deltaproteobacteria bacterium]
MDAELAGLVEDYVDAHTDDVSTLLEELLAETEKITGRSRWSIGKVEGKLLQLLIKISDARRVVEVGTFTGYSALAMAEALPQNGRLTTLENGREFADIALRYFEKSPYGRKIQLIFGPALQSLKAMPDNSQDFVFIDADKPSYGVYFDEALRILRSGGIILVDNVFWRYKIFKKKISNDNARAIAAFNEKVKLENRVEKVMLSVRDGVYLIRKK